MDNVLSVEVAHDYLPEWNNMLALPNENAFDDEERRIARAVRLRLWRKGPAGADELRLAVELEIAEYVEHGSFSSENAEKWVDRVLVLLSGDASIADPPDVDEVDVVLERCHESYERVHRPWHEAHNGPLPPFPHPDRYGHWPGVNWRQVVEWSLGRACNPAGRLPTTSERVAWAWLRREKMEQAAKTATQEKAVKLAAVDLAVRRLPVVFDDDRQTLLRHFIELQAGGDLTVPVSGDPEEEASLLVELLKLDPLALPEHAVVDVLDELVRFVSSWASGGSLVNTVPAVGYALVKREGMVVGVTPGHMRLTIECGEHVLHSPRFPRPVRMSAKDFRNWKRCAQAIYDQARVEADFPPGHWKRWWPSLAMQLSKMKEVIEEGDRHMKWALWLYGLKQSAPVLAHAPGDGSVYVSAKGGTFAKKAWLTERAIQDGIVGAHAAEEFAAWLPMAHKNRRDAAGHQYKLVELPKKKPLSIEGFVAPEEKIDVAGSDEPDTPRNTD
jgi:hypothetical protein